MEGRCVFVLDDQVGVRVLLEEVLSEAGYYVVSASAPHEALGLLYHHKPDLLLVDYKMPEMDGLQFLRESRNCGYRGPAVLMTAYGDIPLVREHNVSSYLAKPFDIFEACRVVDSFMNIDRRSAE